MDEQRRIIRNGAVAIEDGEITKVGSTDDVSRGFAPDEVIDAKNCLVMPGLVCAHTHLYGIALRGSVLNVSPPSEFLQTLQRVWWPLDEKMNNEDAYATALAASIESIMGGTTCFMDTYSAPNEIAGSLDYISAAINEVGLRGVISFEATERRSAAEGKKGLQENIRFLNRKDKGRSMGMISLHASFTISDDLIKEGADASAKYGVPITIHVSEGQNDPLHNIERYGKRTVERLGEAGLLSSRAVLGHCVYLNERELELIRLASASVAHNPMSNMLNAVGVTPLKEMVERGINVGLGNDGYIFDMFENMRAGYLLHRVARKDPNWPSPQQIVEMCTVNAAKAYGLSWIGSIAVGKKADLIIIRPGFQATPYSGSIYGYIVNGLKSSDVRDVVVDGELIVRERRFLKIDIEKSEGKVLRTIENLWRRLGQTPPAAIEPLK